MSKTNDSDPTAKVMNKWKSDLQNWNPTTPEGRLLRELQLFKFEYAGDQWGLLGGFVDALITSLTRIGTEKTSPSK